MFRTRRLQPLLETILTEVDPSSLVDPDQAPLPELPVSRRAAALDQLANLPHDLTSDCLSTGFEALDAKLPGQGWPTGELIELLVGEPGQGELGLLVPALAQVAQRHRSCVWVLPSEQGNAAAALPYPPALASAGIDLTRSLFVRPAIPRESFWALEQALRAAHLGAVIGWIATGTAEGDFRALRRLQLLAGRHQALVFILRAASCAQAPSPAALRLQLAAADGTLQVKILKRRGRPLLEPIALQIHPQSWQARRIDATASAVDATPPVPGARMTPALPSKRWSLASIFTH